METTTTTGYVELYCIVPIGLILGLCWDNGKEMVDCDLVVSENQGYNFVGPYNKNHRILGSILGPLFRETSI